MSIIESSWYSHPRFYDLAFRSETRLEADFIEVACRKYCPFPVRRLLEPACGTGRLVTEMAARGYQVTGIDLSQPALDFLAKRLERRKLRGRLLLGDMADFSLGRPIDAAFNTMNSFRHLMTEEAARRHLECVAAHLRPGGIYILGFHLIPPDADEECTERWTERQGKTSVSVTFRVLSASRRRRTENIRVSMLVRTGGPSKDGQRAHAKKASPLRIRDEFPLRMYTARQFRSLLKKVPSLALRDVYDFWYELDEPLELDDELSDTVFILQKLAC